MKISPQDAHLLEAFDWSVDSKGYVSRLEDMEGGRQRRIYLHRVILDAPAGVLVDHRNGDRSDNTRENIRTCTHAENMRNSKVRKNNKLGIKGVYFDKHRNKFRAAIRLNTKRRSLGSYNTADEAKAAYDAAAQALHGAFARA